MRKLCVGLDFDGVISDRNSLRVSVAKKLFGVNIASSQFRKELVIEKGWLTAEQYRELQRNMYATRECGFLMEPVAEMLTYLPKLINQYKILIITSRSGLGVEIAKEWLERYNIVLQFSGVGYRNTKVKAAAGLDVFVDDDFEKLLSLIGVVPTRFLFSWEYNKHIVEGTIADRVFSWRDLYFKLKSLG